MPIDRKNDTKPVSMHMRANARLASTYRRIGVKHLLFCFALVYSFISMWRTGFLLNFLFLSMPIYLILLVISLKKRIGKSMLNIDIYTLTLFVLFVLFLWRAFSFYNYVIWPVAQISDPKTLIISPTLQTVGFDIVQDRFSIIWSWYYIHLTEIVFFLALLSLSYWNKLKNTICLFIFPLTYSVFLSITSFPLFTFIDQYRWLLSSFFFLLIAAAFALRKIISAFDPNGFAENAWKKVKRRRILKTLPLLIVLPLSFSYFFYAQYGEQLDTVRSGDLFSTWNWEPAVNWIMNNTSSYDVLMSRKPREWSWYTERAVVFTGSQDKNMTQLRQTIKQYNVSYFIVDGSFYWWHQDNELRTLYTNPSEHVEEGFIIVFVFTSSSKIMIYDVAAIATS